MLPGVISTRVPVPVSEVGVAWMALRAGFGLLGGLVATPGFSAYAFHHPVGARPFLERCLKTEGVSRAGVVCGCAAGGLMPVCLSRFDSRMDALMVSEAGWL